MSHSLKLFLMIIISALFMVLALRYCSSVAAADVPSEARVTMMEEPLDVDPLPSSVMRTEPQFPTSAHLKLMGRLSEGIYRWKTSSEAHPYFFCGEAYEGEAAKDQAILAAFHVVKASWDPKTGKTLVNPWGVAGTAAKESQFDVCAFGLYPRLTAYSLKDKNGKPILKPSRLSISHKKRDVLRAMRNPKLDSMYRAYDLGVLQVLDVYYIGYLRHERLEGQREDLLSWEGFYWQVRVFMRELATRYCTKRPWMYWPGHRSERYDKSVVRYARKLGAMKGEI